MRILVQIKLFVQIIWLSMLIAPNFPGLLFK